MENHWIWGCWQTNKMIQNANMIKDKFFLSFIHFKVCVWCAARVRIIARIFCSTSMVQLVVDSQDPNILMHDHNTHTTRHPEYPYWTTCTINIIGNNLIFNNIIVINTWPLTSHNSTPSLVRFETFIIGTSHYRTLPLWFLIPWAEKWNWFYSSSHIIQLHLASC